MTRLKLYAAFALAFLFSLLGVKHYHGKAKVLKFQLAKEKQHRQARKQLMKELAEAQQREFDRVEKATTDSRDKRDYFSKRL